MTKWWRGVYGNENERVERCDILRLGRRKWALCGDVCIGACKSVDEVRIDVVIVLVVLHSRMGCTDKERIAPARFQ
jgi:hypothetical protein